MFLETDRDSVDLSGLRVTISSLAFKKSKKKSSCYGVFHADMQLTSNAVFTLLRN